METFERGETVVLSITIKEADGTEKNPATSTKVTITDPGGTAVVDDVAMDNDAVGAYHYDYTTAGSSKQGTYDVLYVAIDGSRTTKHKDKFEVADV